MKKVHSGINLRDLDKVFLTLGGKIVILRRTGEAQYIHPALSRCPRVNVRRKDSPRELSVFVQKLEKLNVAAANNLVA